MLVVLRFAVLAIGEKIADYRPVGRYAHCAFMFGDNMVVYGGRGYHRSQRSLSPLRQTVPLAGV